MHRLEKEAAEDLVAEAQARLEEARETLAGHPELLHAGFVHDAQKEFVEARITLALIGGTPVPTPDDLKASPQAYLKGMAESIGELRRHILDLMRKGNLERCEELLGDMDEMYYVLVSMDYPDGITMGLRRLTDVARSIIERTRGDFTTSTVQKGLQDALQAHTMKLEGA
jgi:translin